MEFQVGDWVVYGKTKHSTSPGPRATDITPSQGGEEYSYHVDKYWVVAEVHADHVVLKTRRGKQHKVPKGDPNLRRPTLWERWWRRHRFAQEALV